MFFVNLLNQIYWVLAATAGALLGYVIHFDTTGIEFVMTALFVVMFLNQWEEAKDHRPALTGLICSAVCLLLFGNSKFIVPSMILIILCLSAEHKYSKRPEVAAEMTMTTTQAIITIAAVVLGTMAPFIPFIDFPRKKSRQNLYNILEQYFHMPAIWTSHYLLSQRCPVEQHTWAS